MQHWKIPEHFIVAFTAGTVIVVGTTDGTG
jgi:hypothetical protein